MKKKGVLLGIIITFLIVGLSGCNEQTTNNLFQSEEDKFVGTWKSGYSSMTLFSDGTCSYIYSGTWDLKDGKLVLEVNLGSLSLVYDYYFSEDENILYLKEANQEKYIEYIKQ